jgi:hypothetical protein
MAVLLGRSCPDGCNRRENRDCGSGKSKKAALTGGSGTIIIWRRAVNKNPQLRAKAATWQDMRFI